MTVAAYEEREFPMTVDDYNSIVKLSAEYTGIALNESKKNMIYSRLARRIRDLKLKNFTEYISYLTKHKDDELSDFVNTITTNLTSFFRESHHFDYLSSKVISELKRKHQTDQRIRIWSAGCSSGQEPYSIAMSLQRAGFPSSWDVKILATDLDSNVLQKGKTAIYDQEDIDGVDEKYIKGYILQSDKNSDIRIKDTIRKYVTFKRLNLFEPWPMKGPFDVIFCRNVVIYFDKPTQRQLFDKYADMLDVGGYLFIGHSENLHGICDRFEHLGHTIYRKIK